MSSPHVVVEEAISALELLGLAEPHTVEIFVDSLPPGYVCPVRLKVPQGFRYWWLDVSFDVSRTCALGFLIRWTLPNGYEKEWVTIVDGALNHNRAWLFRGARPIKDESLLTILLANITDYTGNPYFDVLVPFAQKVNGGKVTIDCSVKLYVEKANIEHARKVENKLKASLE